MKQIILLILSLLLFTTACKMTDAREEVGEEGYSQIFSNKVLSSDVQQASTQLVYRGMDISTLELNEQDGVIYKENHEPKDAVAIMQGHDVNLIRIRLFHTPNSDDYGASMDLTYVTNLASRIKAAGLQFMLDFHYSDTWADPGQQSKPAAWEGLSFVELHDSVTTYTSNVISHLRQNGVMPDVVQIGNEINCGMLWPEGNVCEGAPWSDLVAFINAGISGVDLGRGTETMPRIVVHVAMGGDQAATQWFFDNLLGADAQFDIIGQSFYTEYHGTLDDLSNNLEFMAGTYPHDILIAETGEYWGGGPGGGPNSNTPEKQHTFLENLIQRVEATPDGKGIGVVYWEPTWVWNSTVGYRALFEPDPEWDDVNMLPAMTAFDVDDGGSCMASIMSVSSVEVTSAGIGGGDKIGQATITIIDDCGNPVTDATVSGTFSGDINESGSAVTDSNGVAVIETTGTARGKFSISFCVDDVTHASLSYDPNANNETCDTL